MIDSVRVSEGARDQLITLKRYTGIKNWNTLCRWALCISLREESVPPNHSITTDSSIDMKWETFGGAHADLYWALIKQRCRRDGLPIDEKTLSLQFKLHLHRGIGYLMGDRELRRIDALINKVI